MKIPDYYKQFQNQPPKDDDKSPKQESVTSKAVEENRQKPEPKAVDKTQKQPTQQSQQVKDKTVPYQANDFKLDLLENWQDKTIYTLTGPVTDGIQHNVIINVDKETEYETLEDFAEWQIKSLEEELKGCTLLKKGETKLTNGTPAYEAIFSWHPTDDLRIYQHQIFTIIEKVAYKMTASFTKKTRQTIGPPLVRMMLSLNPSVK